MCCANSNAVPESETETRQDNCNKQETSLSESLKLLQQHGMTLLQSDDNNILSSVMENGHSVVLTEVGKEVLNSVKVMEPIPHSQVTPKIVQRTFEKKRILTLTPEEFLAMTATCGLDPPNVLKQLNGKVIQNTKPTIKRIVMKKNKMSPISQVTSVSIHFHSIN